MSRTLSKIFGRSLRIIEDDDIPETFMHVFVNNKINVALKNKSKYIPQEVTTILVEDIFNFIQDYKWIPSTVNTLMIETDVVPSVLKTIPKNVKYIMFGFAFVHFDKIKCVVRASNIVEVYGMSDKVFESTKFKKRLTSELKSVGLKIKKRKKIKTLFYDFELKKITMPKYNTMILEKNEK